VREASRIETPLEVVFPTWPSTPTRLAVGLEQKICSTTQLRCFAPEHGFPDQKIRRSIINLQVSI